MCLHLSLNKSLKKEEKKDDDSLTKTTLSNPEEILTKEKEKEGKVAHLGESSSSSKLELATPPKSSHHKSERKLDSEKIVVITNYSPFLPHFVFTLIAMRRLLSVFCEKIHVNYLHSFFLSSKFFFLKSHIKTHTYKRMRMVVQCGFVRHVDLSTMARQWLAVTVAMPGITGKLLFIIS